MDQFVQMKTMLSSFLPPRQETRTAFCTYMASQVEALEDREFQTFGNKAVKSRTDERSYQPQQPQQQTLSRSSSATSTFVPQTFQPPRQDASAAREYILTMPETQIPTSQVIQPAQQSQMVTKGQQQKLRGQLTSFLVVDDQQARPSSMLTFTLTPMKHFHPLSVTSATGKGSQHRTLKLLWESTVSDELPTD